MSRLLEIPNRCLEPETITIVGEAIALNSFEYLKLKERLLERTELI